jgi:hypothetical protein
LDVEGAGVLMVSWLLTGQIFNGVLEVEGTGVLLVFGTFKKE